MEFMKRKSDFYGKMLNNIGIMQGRMVPSEKKSRIQYFPIKNWSKIFFETQRHNEHCARPSIRISPARGKILFFIDQIKAVENVVL